MRYCFVFVCQAGELELKSMLLAASLKHYLRCEYECVVAIPHPDGHYGQVSGATLAWFEALGVRLWSICNPLSADYPIGHKLACLDVKTAAHQIVFLDSDLLCLRPLPPESVFPAPFNAKPADSATFTADSDLWQQVYRLFGLSMPTSRMIATVSGERLLPYFNAGVIAIQKNLPLAKTWQACCQRIDADASIPNKRPWLDQIALPVAVRLLNSAYHCLDERFNYPAHLKPLTAELPYFCHYHWPTTLRREILLNQVVIDLARVHPLLKQKLLESLGWAQLLQPYTLHKVACRSWSIRRWFKKPRPPYPEVIITGIPRSGTSYLCRLLHTVQDCVVLNEPTQIFAPLIEDPYPWRIALFYQELRRTILEGQPIENKLHQGQLVEDTATVDDRASYYPKVSRPDFLLGTKNTLAYLARLPQLKRIMPQATIIACIRHPLDTIASWKSSFPHLAQATVTDFPVGQVNDPFLSPWQQARLQEIAATSSLAVKRALLWCYLAECLLMHRAQLILIHYETLVCQPAVSLHSILKQIPHIPSTCFTEPLKASVIRQKRAVLTEEDRQAITDLCGQYAMELGYNINTL